MNRSRSLFVFWLVLACAPGMAATATPAVWNLKSTTQRALEITPELRAADAEVAARKGELKQAGSWPNPTAALSASNSFVANGVSSGASYKQFSFSQPLPIRRLSRQRAMADANLTAARASRDYRRLLVERQAARVFHRLQLAVARRALAQRRLKLVSEFLRQRRHRAGDHLVRFLTPLERQRLAILNEDAQQSLFLAKRKYEAALIEFRIFLQLPPDSITKVAPLTAPPIPDNIKVMVKALDSNPVLIAARQRAKAAHAGIAVADSQRLADPVLTLFRARGVFGAQTTVTGVKVNVQIPLWNANNGGVDKAHAEAMSADDRLLAASRDARIHLEQARVQLVTLLAQAGRMREKQLDPARKVLTLTRGGFAAGEVNILALVDATATYFGTYAHYLELLQESDLAAADLRLAEGVSILSHQKGILP